MMFTLRSKTRYEAMRWQATQEVYDEFLEWQPAAMVRESPCQSVLRVTIEADKYRQTDIYLYPGDWLVCELRDDGAIGHIMRLPGNALWEIMEVVV